MESVTKSELAMLVEQAEARIEVSEDGTEFLDGYSLSPNNDDPWLNKKPGQARGIILGNPVVIKDYETTPLTNAQVREFNIRILALGGTILIRDPKEVMRDMAEDLRRERIERSKSWVGRLGKVFGAYRDVA